MKTKLFLIMILILLFIALASIAWQSTFTRLYADDYCIGAAANRLNLVDFIEDWYTAWTGRFSYLIFAWLLAKGGARLAAVLPSLTLMIWLVTLAWSSLPVLKRYGNSKLVLPAISFSALILLVLLKSTPNLFQSFFWRDGLINYTFPLIGLSLTSGLIMRAWQERKAALWCSFIITLLSFINGGFSEVFSTMQVALYGLLILVVLWIAKPPAKKVLLKVLTAALIGATLALIVVLLAPGNTVRQSLLAEHPDLIRMVTFSVRNAVHITVKFFFQTLGWALLAVVASVWAGLTIFAPRDEQPSTELQMSLPQSLRKRWQWLLIPFMTFMVIIAACAPVVYMLNAYPDERTILLPQFILIIGLMVSIISLIHIVDPYARLHFQRGKTGIRLGLSAIFLVGMVIATTFELIQSVQKRPEFQQYTRSWEAREDELLSRVEENAIQVTIPGLSSRFGLSDLRAEPDFWVNRCMADFYQVETIIGR